ncbi:hypothetical protein ACNQGE_00945 [Flavobacterium sp. XS1P27]
MFQINKQELKFWFLICSPDGSGKPFEAELQIFPEKKERLKEAPFLSWKKAIVRKSLKRSAGNSSRNKL